MAGFVKLDCGMLYSTLWQDYDARLVFLASLMMASPYEVTKPEPQLELRWYKPTGWYVPPGWYGLVPAAAQGIIAAAGNVPFDKGFEALDRLCSPEEGSRSPDHEGRRMARISEGYLILNFYKYRDKDYKSAERMKRYRERQKAKGIAAYEPAEKKDL